MATIDPITGLLEVDDLPQDTCSSVSLRPQSPLVRGSHLDKSLERPIKRSNLSFQLDDDCLQPPAKGDELRGIIPPAFVVVHPKDRLNHIIDTIQCVINGNEEHVTDYVLLGSHPPNLEKTRFSMSKKKLKLQFIDDILDRFDDERWLHPEKFARERKLWHKSVQRSLKYINAFLENRTSAECGLPSHLEQSTDETTFNSTTTHVSTTKRGRGAAKTKIVDDSSMAPKKRGRKTKNDIVEDGLATVAKLTLPVPASKIPKKSNQTDGESEPATKKKKNENVEKEGKSDEKSEEKKEKVKKPAFTSKRKRGKKGEGEVSNGMETRDAHTDSHLLPISYIKEDKHGSIDGDMHEFDVKEMEIVRAMSIKSKGSGQGEATHGEDIKKKLEEYNRIDEDEDVREISSEKSLKGDRSSQRDEQVSTLVIPSDLDDGMETDDEDWDPRDTGRESTPIRGLLTSTTDTGILQSTRSTIVSQSSQSLFGSLNSPLMASPNTSFSSQSSSLLAPSSIQVINLSASLLPSSTSLLSQPLATSTQIPHSQAEVKKENSGNKGKTKTSSSSGPRVKPTFGKRK